MHLLSRTSKSGLGSAYRAGFAWGLERGYDACVEIDADFSHDPAALPTLVAPLDVGFDVVIGSRYIEGGSIPNWACSTTTGRCVSPRGSTLPGVSPGTAT